MIAVKRRTTSLFAAMIVGLCLLVGCHHAVVAPASRPAGVFTTAPVAARNIDDAIRGGLDFLVKSQNPDGSWSTGVVSHGNEVTASVPGSHQAFKVAVTALATMALRQSLAAGFDESAKQAHDRAVEWLVVHGQSRREEGELLYTFWANIYATQALSQEMLAGNTDPRMKAMAAWHVDRLNRYSTYIGGWNYYDFEAQTQHPAMGPTSFGSGAGLIALWDAKQAGLDVPQKLVDMTVRRLEEMHLPTGAYLYSIDMKFEPMAFPAHFVPGSLGRTQVANLALMTWGSKKVTGERASKEMVPFFADHGAVEMGRKTPMPHQSWYQTSGYYYYFGEYYGSCLLKTLGGEQETVGLAKLAREHILPHQESDGSWWDYAMWDYHKPYGTSFAIMTLLNCRDTAHDALGARADRN